MVKWLSIRGKIIGGFLICFLFMGLITVIDYLMVSNINDRLVFMETAHELLNTVLEMRRYEKNYFLYTEQTSYHENSQYTDKALGILRDNAREMIRIAGADNYKLLSKTLDHYQSLMNKMGKGLVSALGQETKDQIRTEGERLVRAAENIVSKERNKTSDTLRHSQYIPLFFLAALAGLAAYIVHLVAKKIVAPLVSLEKIALRLARGEYSTIHVEDMPEDEICHVILTFNNMMEELEKRQSELLQSGKMAAIGTFTSGIAHELNNPINNICLTVDTYMQDYSTLSETDQLELLNDISLQAERAAEIVRNLLGFSRSEKAVFQTVSIEAIINSTIRLVKNQFMVSNVILKLFIPEDLPGIKGEQRGLEQVFLNLVVNGLQAMPNGGMLTIEARDDDDYVKVMVTDMGMGISHDNLSRIFDPFFSTKNVGEGTGLGLSVSYGIVKKHGGDIQVHSTPNVGTTFIISLPKEQSLNAAN
ncbi:MAG: HAMP domain-containing sensor histidine kinase [Pseudomonadota bacterium]